MCKGPILTGTVSAATAKCGRKNCRCKTDKSYLHGPYYRWTGILEGKRTTITLTEEEAKECERRIKNWKELQEKLAKVVKQSLDAAPWSERTDS